MVKNLLVSLQCTPLHIFVDAYLWPSSVPLRCWRTSLRPAHWTKPCKNRAQHVLESPSPPLACSQWGGRGERLKMSLLSCWKTRCRKGGCPLWHCSSVRCGTPCMRLGGMVQKSLWCLMLELEVREWRMVGEERKRSSLWMIVSNKIIGALLKSSSKINAFCVCVLYSLTTLSLMLLLTPVLPPAVTLQ